MTKRKSPETIAVTNGVGEDPAFGGAAPPLYPSSTFRFKGFEQPGAHDYSRSSNPTRALLADTLAQLEGGAGAIVTSSGMAAVDLVLSLLSPGDLIVAPHDCYGGTHRLLTLRAAKQHFGVAFVDQTDGDALRTALARGPKLVLVETPSNPLMRVVDIAAVAAAARAAGARVAVDNTFLSPALQTPLALGADFVIHSTTKYLNGHSDVVGGAVICAREADAEALSAWANAVGVTGSAWDAWLTLRGLRTLFARIERQQHTAARIAAFLAQNADVAAVHYPGLSDHPGHALAQTQQRGFGAMLSFEIRGGRDNARAFVEALKIVLLAESLGGVESLIAHPATMTHLGMSPEAREIAGITDTLLRLSVGLEGEEDLIADLAQALEAARG